MVGAAGKLLPALAALPDAYSNSPELQITTEWAFMLLALQGFELCQLNLIDSPVAGSKAFY